MHLTRKSNGKVYILFEKDVIDTQYFDVSSDKKLDG